MHHYLLERVYSVSKHIGLRMLCENIQADVNSCFDQIGGSLAYFKILLYYISRGRLAGIIIVGVVAVYTRIFL